MKKALKWIRWIVTILVTLVAYFVGQKTFARKNQKIIKAEANLQKVETLKKAKVVLDNKADMLTTKDETLIEKIKEVDKKIEAAEAKTKELTDEEKSTAVGNFIRGF